MPDVISFEEAKRQGLKFYYTGKPCKRGHLVERYISGRNCTACIKRPAAVARRAKWSADNHERMKRERKRHYAKNQLERPALFLFYAARRRARDRGLTFDIGLEDIVIPAVCPVLGIPLKSNTGTGVCGASANSPSLDRIDNTRGYEKGNVAVISYRANQLKSEATLEESEAVTEYIRRSAAPNRNLL